MIMQLTKIDPDISCARFSIAMRIYRGYDVIDATYDTERIRANSRHFYVDDFVLTRRKRRSFTTCSRRPGLASGVSNRDVNPVNPDPISWEGEKTERERERNRWPSAENRGVAACFSRSLYRNG